MEGPIHIDGSLGTMGKGKVELRQRLWTKLGNPLRTLLSRGTSITLAFRKSNDEFPGKICNINTLADAMIKKHWDKNEDMFLLFEKALTLAVKADFYNGLDSNTELDLGKLAEIFLSKPAPSMKARIRIRDKAIAFLKKPPAKETFRLLREIGVANKKYESPVKIRFGSDFSSFPESRVLTAEWFGSLIKSMQDSGVLIKPAKHIAFQDRSSGADLVICMLSEHLCGNYLLTNRRIMLLLKRSMEAVASAARDVSPKKKSYMLDLSILIPEKLKALKIDETKIEDIIECADNSIVMQFLAEARALRIQKLQ